LAAPRGVGLVSFVFGVVLIYGIGFAEGGLFTDAPPGSPLTAFPDHALSAWLAVDRSHECAQVCSGAHLLPPRRLTAVGNRGHTLELSMHNKEQDVEDSHSDDGQCRAGGRVAGRRRFLALRSQSRGPRFDARGAVAVGGANRRHKLSAREREAASRRQ